MEGAGHSGPPDRLKLRPGVPINLRTGTVTRKFTSGEIVARYVEKNLMPEEQIVYQGQLSLWHLAPKIVAGLLLLPLFGIGLLLWLDVFIQYKSTELAITNKRIVAKFGFIRRSTVEIGIRKIESIQIHQGILGRLFGFGSIVMAGAGNPQAPIPGISDPMEFRKRFLQQQEATT